MDTRLNPPCQRDARALDVHAYARMKVRFSREIPHGGTRFPQVGSCKTGKMPERTLLPTLVPRIEVQVCVYVCSCEH